MTDDQIRALNAQELLTAVLEEKDESDLLELIRKGGKATTEHHGNQRVKACAGCEYAGNVTPLPGATYIGCQHCGCPFATKAYMLNLLFKKSACPHPKGSRWQKIDKIFQQ